MKILQGDKKAQRIVHEKETFVNSNDRKDNNGPSWATLIYLSICLLPVPIDTTLLGGKLLKVRIKASVRFYKIKYNTCATIPSNNKLKLIKKGAREMNKNSSSKYKSIMRTQIFTIFVWFKKTGKSSIVGSCKKETFCGGSMSCILWEERRLARKKSRKTK